MGKEDNMENRALGRIGHQGKEDNMDERTPRKRRHMKEKNIREKRTLGEIGHRVKEDTKEWGTLGQKRKSGKRGQWGKGEIRENWTIGTPAKRKYRGKENIRKSKLSAKDMLSFRFRSICFYAKSCQKREESGTSVSY